MKKQKTNRKRKKTESLKTAFLVVTLIPIISMAIIIVFYTRYRITKTIENEEKEGMSNVACLFEDALERIYPGDYELIKSDKYVALAKGGVLLDINEDLETYKEETGIETTIFYDDVRMITTLKNAKGVSMQGTTSNYIMVKDVIEGDKPGFYSNVKVGDKNYYAYYKPLHNSDGSVVGMLALLKSAEAIDNISLEAIIPIYCIAAVVMVLAGVVSVMYSQRIIDHFGSIKKCLVAMENDNYSVEINPNLLHRRDELGEMANAIVSMRGVIKKYTEMDGLTGVFNRRYAQKRLVNLVKSSKISGSQYSLCIADIDYFKKVNDTYGHDAGDVVLINVSYELKKFMQGKGFVARWGGEEFLLVFEKNDLETSAPMLEKLRNTILDLRFSFDMDKQISMSFGVADGAELSADELVKLADNRLYRAKETGRNKIVSTD